MTDRTLLLLAAAAALTCGSGCFDEGLREIDLTGTVRIPLDVAPPSSAALGPVYIGVYASADEQTLGFTYPFMGPVVGSNTWGDSYPYGGTSVGTIAFPCVIEGKCRCVTGRYGDLDDVIDALGIGQGETPPWTAEDYWDECREYFGYTDVEELEFIGQDRLDFHEEDGFFVASWTIWHVDPQDDAPNRPVLWAFVDNGMQSCNPDGGASNRHPDDYLFREGAVFPDVLNMPGKYLAVGDLFSSEPRELAAGVHDGYDIVIDAVYEGQ